MVANRQGTATPMEFRDRAFVLLGRARHCDVHVDGEGVLDEHARLEREPDDVVRVVALDASRPVLVNGRAVVEATLREGDRLRIGTVEVSLRAPVREPRSRLAALGAFASAADSSDTGDGDGADGGEPAPGGALELRSRLALEELTEISPEELPDVAHELRTLRRILEVNKRLARAPDEETLLEGFLDAANALAGSERAFLLAADEEGGVAVLRSRDLAGQEPARGAGPVERELDRELVLEVLSSGIAGVASPGAPRAALCVPLPGSEPLALYVDARQDDDLFRPGDAPLLTAFGEQVSVALERVRLLGETERQQQALRRAAEQAERLNRRLAELLERRTAELRAVRADLAAVDEGFRHRYEEIVGRGPAMLAVLRQVDRIADTNVPVLFEGESGTGKELLARALHASSGRRGARFVAENCAALPDTLLENELFGHERGAFTGADAATQGLFERADGGTLFLDEVGDMSQSLQKRLLRVLQEGEVRRVGGSTVTKVDVRVVTATNRDLSQLVREGRFREDLFYRLAVVKVRVPPLRERREDVPELVRHFVARVAQEAGPCEVTDPALDALVRYDWPGNIRQLDNELRRAAALSRGLVDLDSLSEEVRENRSSRPADPSSLGLDGRDLRALVEELEVRVVGAVLEREAGNITRAARALGLSRLGLRKKAQRLGLAVPNAAAAASARPERRRAGS